MTQSVINICRQKRQQAMELKEGEALILKMSGSYDAGSPLVSLWKLCNVALTNRRIIFYQVGRVLVSIYFGQISKAQIVRRPWILKMKKNQIYLELKNHRRKFLFICVRETERWKATIEYLKRTQEALGVKNSGN